MARANHGAGQVPPRGKTAAAPRRVIAMADEAVFPVWRYVDRLEQLGEITEFEAHCWKHEIFSLMLERGLEPDGLVRIFEEPVPAF